MFLVDVATNTSSITAAEFAQRVADAVVVLINSVSGIIVPIATLSLLVSVVLLIIGSFTQSSKIKKAGASGIGATVLGLIVYYAAPTIISLFSSLQLIFR